MMKYSQRKIIFQKILMNIFCNNKIFSGLCDFIFLFWYFTVFLLFLHFSS